MDMDMDRIFIKNISLYGYHGVLPEEEERGQEFLISVELFLDYRGISHLDSLENTLDYSRVLETIREVFYRKRFQLLESLSECVANEILQLKILKKVRVTVCKPRPPLPGITGGVEVSAEREKATASKKGRVVYLGLGSNQGDRLDYLKHAVARLNDYPDIEVTDASPVYKTEPVGIDTSQDFYNAALKIKTSLSPVGILSCTKKIEWELGRRRKNEMLSRVIDIDLLQYENVILNSPLLSLPHPSIPERWFVLVPLNDIAPHLIPAGCQQSVSEMLSLLGEPEGINPIHESLM